MWCSIKKGHSNPKRFSCQEVESESEKRCDLNTRLKDTTGVGKQHPICRKLYRINDLFSSTSKIQWQKIKREGIEIKRNMSGQSNVTRVACLDPDLDKLIMGGKERQLGKCKC